MQIVQKLFLFFVLSVATGNRALADETSWEQVPWGDGKGVYDMAICQDGHWVDGMRNIDHGRNNQSLAMRCRRLPAREQRSCKTVPVQWWGGKGLKSWAACGNGRYVAGLSITDFGSNNQAIGSMSCCAIGGGNDVFHGDYYHQEVTWTGGRGAKQRSLCKDGYFVTALVVRDHGRNNQSVSDLTCTAPSAERARSYPFPGRATDLSPGEYWFLERRHHKAKGNQTMGYDLTAVRFDSVAKSWSRRKLNPDPVDRNDRDLAFGLPVYAIADGKVTFCRRTERDNPNPPQVLPDRKAGGNSLTVELADGKKMLYAHFQQGSIPAPLCPRNLEGQQIRNNHPEIRTGDFLGRLGNSGQSSGPHLHIHVQHVDASGPAPLLFKDLWVKNHEDGADRPGNWSRLKFAPLPPGPIIIRPPAAR